MYVIFQSGGKQYRASIGEIVRLEKIDVPIGEECVFNKVIMMVCTDSLQVGKPFLSSCNVVGEIIKHGRCSKILIVKFRRRKHFRKCQGHRQYFTEVKIRNINM